MLKSHYFTRYLNNYFTDIFSEDVYNTEDSPRFKQQESSEKSMRTTLILNVVMLEMNNCHNF